MEKLLYPYIHTYESPLDIVWSVVGQKIGKRGRHGVGSKDKLEQERYLHLLLLSAPTC